MIHGQWTNDARVTRGGYPNDPLRSNPGRVVLLRLELSSLVNT